MQKVAQLGGRLSGRVSARVRTLLGGRTIDGRLERQDIAIQRLTRLIETSESDPKGEKKVESLTRERGANSVASCPRGRAKPV